MSNRGKLLQLLNNVIQVGVMLGVRLDKQLEERLNALAEKTNRSKSYLAKEALKRYIEQEEAKAYETQETLARWEHYQETGELVSNDSMMDWLDSWGTEQEKSCPVK
jgi:predicted transcriptional regulator